jgi:hypothetical protein
MKHDIEMLDKKIRHLNHSIAEFAKLPPGFGPIIHTGGWTTEVDWIFFNAGIDNLQSQMETATEFCKRLLEGAKKVETRKESA